MWKKNSRVPCKLVLIVIRLDILFGVLQNFVTSKLNWSTSTELKFSFSCNVPYPPKYVWFKWIEILFYFYTLCRTYGPRIVIIVRVVEYRRYTRTLHVRLLVKSNLFDRRDPEEVENTVQLMYYGRTYTRNEGNRSHRVIVGIVQWVIR